MNDSLALSLMVSRKKKKKDTFLLKHKLLKAMVRMTAA